MPEAAQSFNKMTQLEHVIIAVFLTNLQVVWCSGVQRTAQ